MQLDIVLPTAAADHATDPAATLTSVSASIELAIIQLGRGYQDSALEILAEAMREAKGDPLTLQ